MTALPPSSPIRNPEIEASELPDGLALFDPAANVAHHLNPVATLVWELCDGRPEAEIVAAVGEILEIDPDKALSFTASALNSFRSAGLLG